jgi:hypothetical protein
MKESRRDGMRFAPGNGWVKDEELEHLKRELAQVKQERDIFKSVTTQPRGLFISKTRRLSN